MRVDDAFGGIDLVFLDVSHTRCAMTQIAAASQDILERGRCNSNAVVCKKSAEPKRAQFQVLRRVLDLRFRSNFLGLGGLNSG